MRNPEEIQIRIATLRKNADACHHRTEQYPGHKNMELRWSLWAERDVFLERVKELEWVLEEE